MIFFSDRMLPLKEAVVSVRSTRRREIDPAAKYRPFGQVRLPDRTWPNKIIQAPPIWCSVDLRDGNQALIEPMGPDRKLHMFKSLCGMGFKEIEVGFPSASELEFEFLRVLIEKDLIPDDVGLQVLTQSREELIRRTFESVQGARRVIVHLYNSTSPVQRRLVLKKDRRGIIDLAVTGTKLVRKLSSEVTNAHVTFEYSPESFSATELDFSLDVCEAVLGAWSPTENDKIILNLPATVEMATPNVYADQIEWFSRHLKSRNRIILSIHPHNDRGTAVAAAELALMAGADRVEGTLFGNGERTGNVDLVTLALNMWSQGVDPGLDFSEINRVVQVAEDCTRLPIHPRHPYAGELVFTAFSGSHQDAIRKGLEARRASANPIWEVPYLPIDPADLGRSYEAVIRINSQSGKGGIAYVMEEEFGYRLPRRLQIEFQQAIQPIADATGEELTAKRILEVFETEYLSENGLLELIEYRTERLKTSKGAGRIAIEATVADRGEKVHVSGTGDDALDALARSFLPRFRTRLRVKEVHEHSLRTVDGALTVAYVEVQCEDGTSLFGVGCGANAIAASLKAFLSAVERLDRRGDVLRVAEPDRCNEPANSARFELQAEAD